MSKQSQYLLVSLSLEGLWIAGNHGDIHQSEAQHKRSRADTVFKHNCGHRWKLIYRVRIKYFKQFHRAHWIILVEWLIKSDSTVSPLSKKNECVCRFLLVVMKCCATVTGTPKRFLAASRSFLWSQTSDYATSSTPCLLTCFFHRIRKFLILLTHQ